MGEDYITVKYDGVYETQVARTPDGTFSRNRYPNYVDEDTGLPVYGRWSPWYRTESVETSSERTPLA